MNEPYTVTLEVPAAIIEADSRRSDAVRLRLQQIDSTLILSTFEQSDLLFEMHLNAYWREWKFDSIKDWATKSGIDLSPREIDYRIKEGKFSKLLKISMTDRASAKISKLKVIYTLDPEATYTDSSTQKENKGSDLMIQLIGLAPKKSIKEIKEMVDQILGTVPEEDEFTWLNVKLRRDSKEVIMQAVKLIVAQSGSTIDVMTKEEKDISIGIAIERMAADCLADPNNVMEDTSESGDFVDSIEDEGEALDLEHDVDEDDEE